MDLISAINYSGLMAEYAISAEKDNLGNVISSTYGKKTNDVYYIRPELPYDLYSNTATYAVGDKVVWTAGSGLLYSAKSAVTTPGAWSSNSSKFAGVSTVTFSAENEDITELYDGLKIALYLPSRLAATDSYLNINGLGDVQLYRNNYNKLTSGYFNTSGVVIDFTYISATNRWVWADYDSNSTYAGMVDAYVNLSASATNISAACTNFSAKPGNTINVTFPRDYTAVSAKKFRAGTTTYQPLYLNGSATSNTNYFIPSGTWPVYYDGDNWYLWTDGSIQFSAIRGTVIDGGSTLTAGTDLKIENDIISVNTNGTATGNYAFVAGSATYASGKSTFAIGEKTSALDGASIAMGCSAIASAYGALAQGVRVTANGSFSQAVGGYTYTEGRFSHAEGWKTSAFSEDNLGYESDPSHAEGWKTLARGYGCHAEGRATSATNYYTHTEGNNTLATGFYSHAEGNGTSALNIGTHTEGLGTIASSNYMHVGGIYNKTSADALFVLGNGTADDARSDAFIVTSGGLASAVDFLAGNNVSLSSLTGLATTSWANNTFATKTVAQQYANVVGGYGITVAGDIQQTKTINSNLTEVPIQDGTGIHIYEEPNDAYVSISVKPEVFIYQTNSPVSRNTDGQFGITLQAGSYSTFNTKNGTVGVNNTDFTGLDANKLYNYNVKVGVTASSPGTVSLYGPNWNNSESHTSAYVSTNSTLELDCYIKGVTSFNVSGAGLNSDIGAGIIEASITEVCDV